MENLSLYQINQQLANLLELDDGSESAVDQSTGEIFTKEAWDELKMAQEEKVEGTLLWCKSRQALANAIKQEAKALKERADAIEAQIARAEARVIFTLENDEKFGGAFESSKVKAKTKSSYSCPDEIDIAQLSSEYVETVPESKKINKKKLLAALNALRKEGKEAVVCGVHIVEKVNLNYK